MKKATSVLVAIAVICGLAITSCSDSRQGKHHSHKGSKKKKSGYFHDFQH